jgi:RNA polymerase sigma factor (sigma-70 family)
MRIVRRQTCEAKFCSFLRFDPNSSITTTQWVRDHQLARNFNNHYHSTPETAILQHLQTILQHQPENTLAFKHLCAYLQEPCYWVANWFIRHHSLPNQFHSSLDHLIQVFKIAEAETLNRDKLVHRLRQHNPQRSQLKTYVQKWLKSAIADAIYAEYRIAKYTNWGLLKNSSATAVRKALSQQGYTQEQIQNYQTAVEYFKSVNAKNQPDAQELEVIVTLYNRQSNLEITTKQVKQWLDDCIQALRQYEQQKCPHHYASSLSVTESNQEEKVSFSQSQVSITPQSELDNSLPATSEELNPFLEEALTHLTLEESHILFLHYGLNLQQSEIAYFEGVNQSSISRKINKLQKQLAQLVAKPIIEKKEMNLKLNYKTLPKDAMAMMRDWLETYFKQPIFQHLAEVFQVQINESNQTCLRLIYGGNYDGNQPLSLEEVAHKLNLSIEQLETNLTQSKQILEQGVVTMLHEKEMNSLVMKQQKIGDLVEEWLRENAIYSLLTPPKKQI